MRHVIVPLLLAVTAPPMVAPTSSAGARTRAPVPVPAVLRGVWAARIGPIKEPCTPESDDFKWSFTADRDRFHYWEARGTPTRVRQTAPNRFVIDLAKTGEGFDWKERRTYTLLDLGRTLVVDVPVPDLKLRESRFVRCPDRAVAPQR